MTTNLKNLIVSYLQDVHPDVEDRHTNSGFTAKTYTAGEDEHAFNTEGELMTGYRAPPSLRSKPLMLSSYTVPPGAARKAEVSIIPTSLNGDKLSLYKTVEKTGDPTHDVEPLGLDTGLDNPCDSFVFSEVVLGDEDLDLGGDIQVLQDNMNVYSVDTSLHRDGATVLHTVDTDEAATSSGTGVTSYDLNNKDLGHWPVVIEVQALLDNFDQFVLPSGQVPPAQGSIKLKSDGVTDVDFDDLVDENGKLLLAFVVDPSKHTIVQQFSVQYAKFFAGSRVPEGLRVYVGDYVAGSTGGGITGIDVQDDEDIDYPQLFYAYELEPRYTMHLPRGTVCGTGLNLRPGTYVPSGSRIAPSSLAPADFIDSNWGTDYNPVTVDETIPLTLENVSFEPGMVFPHGASATSVVLRNRRFIVRKGEHMEFFQPAILGMHTESPMDVDQAEFPAESKLECYLESSQPLNVSRPIIAAAGSLFKKGTMIPAGAYSIKGASIEGEIVLPAGNPCKADVDVSSHFLIEKSDLTKLLPGDILRAPFEFPIGGRFYEGNTLPCHLKLLYQMGVALTANAELLKDTVLGAFACLYGDIGFDPKGIIPGGTTVFGDMTLPTGTTLESGFAADIQLPVPVDFTFKRGDVMPAGLAFRQQCVLPSIGNILSQAGVSTSTSPLKVTDNGAHVIIKAGTSFISGMPIPVGSVLSMAGAGLTQTYAQAVASPSGVAITLVAGSYSLDPSIHAPAAMDLEILKGVPTEQYIYLLSDYHFDEDLVLAVSDVQPDMSKYISFNEPFTLASALTLTGPYTVRVANSVMWPSNCAIPAAFTLSAPFHFTTSVSGMQITKRIMLNVVTSDKYVHGILSDDSHLKMPPAGWKMETGIKLAVDQAVAATGATAFKATVDLAKGTKLRLVGVGSYVTLATPMKVTSDFIVESEFSTVPRIYLPNGIFILAGHKLPGDIRIGRGDLLPSSVQLNQPIILAADVSLTEEYEIERYTQLVGGYRLAIESSFPEGMVFPHSVTLGPILSLSQDSAFYFSDGASLGADVFLPNLEFNGFINYFRTNAGDLIQENATLRDRVDALELIVRAIQGH